MSAEPRLGRDMAVKELVSGATKAVTLKHGENITGRNLFEVARIALCQRPCRWCASLVERCQSRGGRVT